MKSPFVVALRAAACVTAAGCIEAPAAVAPPPPGQAAVPILVALDARGRTCDLAELPRRPRFELTVTGLDPNGPGLLLFEGEADAELLADLERLPLTAASMRRLVPARTELTHDHVIFMPATTLARAAPYTLALPRTALQPSARNGRDAPWTRVLYTASGPNAGAAVRGTFPADGMAGVATTLDFAVLTFDGAVDGLASGTWLEDANGWAVPARIESWPCTDFDTDAVSCVRIAPAVPLQALSEYALRTGGDLRDAHGARIDQTVTRFSTGESAASVPLAFVSEGCALDEATTPVGCALRGDDQLRVRIQLNSPARVRVQLGDRLIARLAGSRPIDVGFDSLAPGMRHALRVHVEAGDSANLDVQFELDTLAALARVSISEVLADPLGPEPDAEWVELLNYGEQPIALRGFAISDRPDELGTRIERDVVMPAGARALLVSDAFGAATGFDVPPAAGALLVPVGASLTRSGLANAGEALYLRDEQRQRVSAAPAAPEPRAGVCASRVSADPRSNAPGSFAYAIEEGCTPGR